MRLPPPHGPGPLSRGEESKRTHLKAVVRFKCDHDVRELCKLPSLVHMLPLFTN